MSDSASEKKRFIPVGQYKSPSLSTDETFRRFGSEIFSWFQKKEEDPFIGSDSLSLVEGSEMDSVAPPPAWASVLDEMTETFSEWVRDPAPASAVQTVVLPPCDESDVVRLWAEQHDYVIIEPPGRERLLLDEPLENLPSVEQEISQDEVGKIYVVPRLEEWFLRHRNGLNVVKQLLDFLALFEGRCLVGCNSWAWDYLTRAVGAEMVLARPLTFVAFDVQRLRTWFVAMSDRSQSSHSTFRMAATGDDVFDCGKNGKPKDDFLQTLAARSCGIPWVAWHLWRSAIRAGSTESPSDHESHAFPEEKTLWISELQELSLPTGHREPALLILHALLLHGSMTLHQLRLVLPSVDISNVIAALSSSGFVSRRSGLYRCAPSAYPDIRSSLKTAGFPTGLL
jgi:hypothetical protein